MFMETQVTQLLPKHKDPQTFITIAYSSSCKKLFLKTKPNDTSHMVMPQDHQTKCSNQFPKSLNLPPVSGSEFKIIQSKNGRNYVVLGHAEPAHPNLSAFVEPDS